MNSIYKEYRNIIRGAHRNVRLFFLGSFLLQLGNGIFGILYNLYIKSMGLPDTVAGGYVSASALAGTIFLVPAGIISDKFGRKAAVLTAGALSTVVMMIQSVVHVPWMIVGGAFLSGMVSSVIWVSVLPLLAENTEKDERFHLFSVNFALGLVAQVIGSVLSGGIADSLSPLVSTVWSLRITLLIGASVGLFSLIPFARIQETTRVTSEPAARMTLRGTFGRVREQRSHIGLIAKFAISSTIIGFGAGLVIPYLNLYFAERFHMTKVGIGIVIGLAQACTALAMFVGPAMAKRIGPVKAVLVFQLSSIPFLLTTAYATNSILASGAVVVRNALMNCANPIQDSIMMALVSEEVRGIAVSVGQTMWNLGWAIMGPVSTRIVHHFGSYTGYAIVFTGTAVLYLIGSIYYGFTFRKHEHKVYESTDTQLAASGGNDSGNESA